MNSIIQLLSKIFLAGWDKYYNFFFFAVCFPFPFPLISSCFFACLLIVLSFVIGCQACLDAGSFYVINHGISKELMD